MVYLNNLLVNSRHIFRPIDILLHILKQTTFIQVASISHKRRSPIVDKELRYTDSQPLLGDNDKHDGITWTVHYFNLITSLVKSV